MIRRPPRSTRLPYTTLCGSIGKVVIAGGKRPGQTAGLARYTVIAGKNGREHNIELGYGIVPARTKKPKDYPLLLPRLDTQLGRFNIDGNTHNILILRFREEDRKLRLHAFRNFNAPCEITVTTGASSNMTLATATLEIAQLRVCDIIDGKLNAKQEPQTIIGLIHHAIEMRAGHMFKKSVS